MVRKEAISPWQYFTLSSIYLIGVSALIMPLGGARQGGWLAVLLAVGEALVLALAWLALAGRFPEDTMYVYSRRLLGRFLGKAVAIGYVLYFVLVGSIALRAIADLYVTAVLHRTPILVFILVLGGLAAWLVAVGLEAMARLSELLLPLILLFVGTLTLLTFITPHLVRWQHLFPLLEAGGGALARSSVVGLAFSFGEAVGLATLVPFLNVPTSSRRSLMGAIVFVGLILAVLALRNIVVLGPEEVGRVIYPSLTATQEIVLGDFLQRIEVLLIFIWTFGAFFKIAVSLYLAALGLGETLARGSYPLFAPAVAIALVLLSILLWDNVPQFLGFVENRYPIIALPFQAVIPVLLLTVASLRGAGRKNGGKK